MKEVDEGGRALGSCRSALGDTKRVLVNFSDDMLHRCQPDLFSVER